MKVWITAALLAVLSTAATAMERQDAKREPAFSAATLEDATLFVTALLDAKVVAEEPGVYYSPASLISDMRYFFREFGRRAVTMTDAEKQFVTKMLLSGKSYKSRYEYHIKDHDDFPSIEAMNHGEKRWLHNALPMHGLDRGAHTLAPLFDGPATTERSLLIAFLRMMPRSPEGGFTEHERILLAKLLAPAPVPEAPQETWGEMLYRKFSPMQCRPVDLEEVPFVIAAPCDQRYEDMLLLAQDAFKRGATLNRNLTMISIQGDAGDYLFDTPSFEPVLNRKISYGANDVLAQFGAARHSNTQFEYVVEGVALPSAKKKMLKGCRYDFAPVLQRVNAIWAKATVTRGTGIILAVKFPDELSEKEIGKCQASFRAMLFEHERATKGSRPDAFRYSGIPQLLLLTANETLSAAAVFQAAGFALQQPK